MRIGFCRELIIVRRRHDRRHGGRLRVASRNDSFSLRELERTPVSLLLEFRRTPSNR